MQKWQQSANAEWLWGAAGKSLSFLCDNSYPVLDPKAPSPKRRLLGSARYSTQSVIELPGARLRSRKINSGEGGWCLHDSSMPQRTQQGGVYF